MKKMSLQWRLTIITTLLIAMICGSLTIFIYKNGVYYIDSLQNTVDAKSEDNNEKNPDEIYISIPDEEWNNFAKNFSIQVYNKKADYKKSSLLFSTLLSLLGGVITFFISGHALKPLCDFSKKIEEVQAQNLSDSRIEENKFSEAASQQVVYEAHGQSGQLTILNKLGCIISTKYPTVNNPFEDEVEYAKKVLNKLVVDDKIFALLFEPDNKKDWATDDEILEHGNPLALELPAIMKDLKDKRQVAIEIPSKRENFITKHCNIVYAGEGTESFVSLEDVRRGKRDKIDWRGKNVYIGVDLSMSNDNCSVAMSSYDSETQGVVCEVIAFLPEDKIEEKNKIERINYYDFIKQCKAIACGDRTVDYAVIEKFVEDIEGCYGVKIMSIGYDRYNALSSAQKWAKKYTTVEIRQHSSLLHAPTKWLSELIANGKFYYSDNQLQH